VRRGGRDQLLDAIFVCEGVNAKQRAVLAIFLDARKNGAKSATPAGVAGVGLFVTAGSVFQRTGADHMHGHGGRYSS
jgi:glycerol-3-phosphate dehydrogenase